MTYGSVCSGIEAATVAWHPLGWRPAWFAEIDKFPSAVLAHHYPEVPNLGDFTTIGADAGPIDLLVGGTPCQDFSQGGKQLGLAGERGQLTLRWLELVERLRPAWILWENVRNVLSISGGRVFGAIIGRLAKLGYRYAWRVLNAVYFGVPQNRPRLFLVATLRAVHPVTVLAERESLSGFTKERRQALAARCLTARGAGSLDDRETYIAGEDWIRHMTPLECERIMGFRDNYTLIPYRGKPAADGPRYKALGNSMAVPVMRWIGERIQMVDAIAQEAA